MLGHFGVTHFRAEHFSAAFFGIVVTSDEDDNVDTPDVVTEVVATEPVLTTTLIGASEIASHTAYDGWPTTEHRVSVYSTSKSHVLAESHCMFDSAGMMTTRFDVEIAIGD